MWTGLNWYRKGSSGGVLSTDRKSDILSDHQLLKDCSMKKSCLNIAWLYCKKFALFYFIMDSEFGLWEKAVTPILWLHSSISPEGMSKIMKHFIEALGMIWIQDLLNNSWQRFCICPHMLNILRFGREIKCFLTLARVLLWPTTEYPGMWIVPKWVAVIQVRDFRKIHIFWIQNKQVKLFMFTKNATELYIYKSHILTYAQSLSTYSSCYNVWDSK